MIGSTHRRGLQGMALFLAVVAGGGAAALMEVNPRSAPEGQPPIAITDVRLIDGVSDAAIPNAAVVVEAGRIVAAGPVDEVDIPEDADVVEGAGLTLTPGLIDAHLHTINDNALVNRFLRSGVTTMRDPGHPFRFYQSLHFATEPMPRVYLTGAHLDGYPPVWRQQAVVVRDEDHARRAVHEHVDQGATGIKIYFNLPLDYYEAVCATAAERGVPVMAHLELVDADDAIRAGVEGMEHVTSFGPALAEPEEASAFKEAVREDYGARSEGRFQLWASLDLGSERVEEVIALGVERNVVLVPTLAIFERRAGDANVEDYHLQGFENMLRFTGMWREAGGLIAVGSHTSGPHAEHGWAYQREMELLAEAGMTPMDIIQSATTVNARYFRADERIGAIAPGMLADLLLIEGNPDEDIEAMYNIHRVMLSGEWID